LTIQKQVRAELSAVRQKAKEEVQDASDLKVREKEEQIASMQRHIEELRRKAEQGSQQLQGEVQELELETILRQKFTHDLFETVPKGEFGGDLIQRVVGPTGQIYGSILWEAKRTKSWSHGWLRKLREDQRAAKADVALIVSHALPKGLQTFDHVDGVWVTEPRCAVPVAIALRESLLFGRPGLPEKDSRPRWNSFIVTLPALASSTVSKPLPNASRTCRPISTESAKQPPARGRNAIH
jgi:hypothetical protein